MRVGIKIATREMLKNKGLRNLGVRWGKGSLKKKGGAVLFYYYHITIFFLLLMKWLFHDQSSRIMKPKTQSKYNRP